MKEKVRWGILGCANIAVKAVIPAIQQSETGTVVAIASRERSKAEETAVELGLGRAWGSYEELVADPGVDAIYIPLPNHLHTPWAIRAAQAGKHVLCEKPIALDEGEAREMASACAAAGVVFAEAFMYRFHPRYDRIKEIIDSGEIGTIRGMHASFRYDGSQKSDNVRWYRDMGGGGIYDVGCYCISSARLLLGREPEAVTAQAFFSPRHDHVDMMASGLVEFPGGVSLTFDCAMWASPRQTLEIIGTEGRIELTESAFSNPRPDQAFITVQVGDFRRLEQVVGPNQYTLMVDDFGRAVQNGTPVRFGPDDAVANIRVVEGALRSARERKRVVL